MGGGGRFYPFSASNSGFPDQGAERKAATKAWRIKVKPIIIPVQTDHTDPADAPESLYSGPSKSQRKRDSAALQDLGEQLVALSVDRLKKTNLPENLYDAVREAQRITSHEGRRRQMQYIGKLMRGVDPAPIRAVIDEVKGISAAATARMHRLERMRTRLIADENVLGEIAREFPAVDLKYLRQMRRNAIKEQEQGKPPRGFREIFRILRDLDAAATPDAIDAEMPEDGEAE